MGKKTPLYETHKRLGARMVEFGGWDMPVQYTSILAEHQATRTAAGLFDICHMGEVQVEGPGALSYLQRVTINDVSRLDVGQAQYSMLCHADGGVIDDIIVYRTGDQSFLVVLNAANTDKDFDWLQQPAVEAKSNGLALDNTSDQTGLLSLQGPRALAILQPLTSLNLAALRYYHCAVGNVISTPALIARTGYTGEDGFELFVPAESVTELWQVLLRAGQPHGLAPVGLGARDTLRLEAAMPLYGHELDDTTNPLEAGLARYVALDKGEWIGRDALRRVAAQGPSRQRIGFEMRAPGIPRQGYEIVAQGQVVGRVTSGTHSPTLAKAIGMAYLPRESASVGTPIHIVIRGQPIAAEVVALPFYRRAK